MKTRQRPRLWNIGIAAAVGLLVAACGGTASTAGPSQPGVGKPAASPPAATAAASAASAKPLASASVADKPAATSASASAKPAASASVGAAVDFNYGIASIDPGVLPAWMAQDQGFDKKNGLALKITTADSGARGLQIMAANQIQLMDIGLSPVILANSSGTNFRVVDSIGNAFGFIIMGGKDITPENAAQKLKGGKIGISSFGSETEVAVNFFIQRLGLVRDKDVSVVQTGNNGTRLAAVMNGAISATPLLAAEALTAQRNGLKPLWDMAEGSDWLFEADAADAGYMKDHRDMLLRWMKAWAEGNYYARSHPDEAKRAIAKEFKYNDAELIDATYQRFLKLAPVNLRPSDASVQAELQHYQTVKDVTLKSTNPSDYIDLSLIDELDKSGFLAQLRKTYNIP